MNVSAEETASKDGCGGVDAISRFLGERPAWLRLIILGSSMACRRERDYAILNVEGVVGRRRLA